MNMQVFESLVPGQPIDPMVAKEIGPEGGVIDLENVARLEIPPGALEQPTKIEIHQVLEVESTKEQLVFTYHSPPEGHLMPGYDFVTPVVRLEPFGLELKVPARLSLSIDKARVGQNDPRVLEYVGSDDATKGSWDFDPFISEQSNPIPPVKRHLDDPLKINTLVYFAKQILTLFGPNDKAGYFHVDTSNHKPRPVPDQRND